MYHKINSACLILFIATIAFAANGQQAKNYNLVSMLKKDMLVTNPGLQTKVIVSSKNAISTMGIVMLKGIHLKDGTIDIDLRGKDLFLKSFLGIAFHAKDTLNYDVIYFRPFRFRSTDTPTRKWSVQYMSMPGNDYEKLRKEHTGVYENDIVPAPTATD